MSHHPTSAELAAFRRSIAPSTMDIDTLRWQDERRHGIGFRIPLNDADILTHARREASAMRSRAYARSVEPVQVYAMRGGPTVEERWYGVPWSWGTGDTAMTLPHDYWDDESPRSPLPIAYRNPIASA